MGHICAVRDTTAVWESHSTQGAPNSLTRRTILWPDVVGTCGSLRACRAGLVRHGARFWPDLPHARRGHSPSRCSKIPSCVTGRCAILVRFPGSPQARRCSSRRPSCSACSPTALPTQPARSRCAGAVAHPKLGTSPSPPSAPERPRRSRSLAGSPLPHPKRRSVPRSTPSRQ